MTLHQQVQCKQKKCCFLQVVTDPQTQSWGARGTAHQLGSTKSQRSHHKRLLAAKQDHLDVNLCLMKLLTQGLHLIQGDASPCLVKLLIQELGICARGRTALSVSF